MKIKFIAVLALGLLFSCSNDDVITQDELQQENVETLAKETLGTDGFIDTDGDVDPGGTDDDIDDPNGPSGPGDIGGLGGGSGDDGWDVNVE